MKLLKLLTVVVGFLGESIILIPLKLLLGTRSVPKNFGYFKGKNDTFSGPKNVTFAFKMITFWARSKIFGIFI